MENGPFIVDRYVSLPFRAVAGRAHPRQLKVNPGWLMKLDISKKFQPWSWLWININPSWKNWWRKLHHAESGGRVRWRVPRFWKWLSPAIWLWKVGYETFYHLVNMVISHNFQGLGLMSQCFTSPNYWGDFISNRYGKVMFKIPKKGHLPTPDFPKISLAIWRFPKS